MKVTYKDHMGTDLSVINAARVSFGKEAKWKNQNEYEHWLDMRRSEDEFIGVLKDSDKSLIAFLARGCTSNEWETLIKKSELLGDRSKGGVQEHKDVEDLMNYIRSMPPHWTPFGHCQITLHLKVPLFVARQIHKHQTGFVVNEVSRRYVTDTPEFYVPDKWRASVDNVKQGSSNVAVLFNFNKFEYEGTSIKKNIFDLCLEEYEDMLNHGICAEQARMVLPQSMYTEFWMTGSLYGFANMFKQRSDPHAQREVQEVAVKIGEIIEPLFPVSWKELIR